MLTWKAKFINYQKALDRLVEATANVSNDQMRDGMIQRFEFTFELAWKMLQDYLRSQGMEDVIGPQGTIIEAFSQGLLHDGESWMEMLKNRNLTVHTYREELAEDISEKIVNQYIYLFNQLREKMEGL